jgi:hypothetical protein
MHASPVGLLTDRGPSPRYSEPVGCTNRSASEDHLWGRIVDGIEATDDVAISDAESAGDDDAEDLLAEKSHGTDSAFGDGSVR